MYSCFVLQLKDQLLPIRPALKGPALELSTLGCLRTHNNKPKVLQRTALDSASPHADYAHIY
jgi:hypothetical protein